MKYEKIICLLKKALYSLRQLGWQSESRPLSEVRLETTRITDETAKC